MALNAQKIDPKQLAHWQMVNGEPVFEYGAVRLPQFRKSFGEDVIVQRRDRKTGELTPFLLRSGRVLKANEVIPFRADLALDEDGVVIEQYEFEKRWEVFQSTYLTAPDFNINDEKIPNVDRFINAKPDTWSESAGMVEIDYDPKPDREFKPRVMFNGERDIPIEEFRKEQARADKMESLLVKLGEHVVGGEEDEPEPLAAEAVTVEHVATELAPCGKPVKEGYVKQHSAKCGKCKEVG